MSFDDPFSQSEAESTYSHLCDKTDKTPSEQNAVPDQSSFDHFDTNSAEPAHEWPDIIDIDDPLAFLQKSGYDQKAKK